MAYIINDPSIAGGIAYSPNKYIMLTKNYTAPVLSDIGLTPISSDQIDLICTLLDDGGKSITKYGVCYRESLLNSDNFYVDDDSVIDLELGTSLSTGVDFHTLISDLKPNTEYSFRTYAINNLTMNGTTSYSNTSHVTTYDKITIYIFSYANIYHISITTPDGTIYKENVGDQIFFVNVKHGLITKEEWKIYKVLPKTYFFFSKISSKKHFLELIEKLNFKAEEINCDNDTVSFLLTQIL